MSVREIPVITDENEWNELCKSDNFHVTTIDDSELQAIRHVYENNLHLVSAMEGKIRHTTGGGIEIRFSGFKSQDDETRSNIQNIYGAVAYDAYKNAELYKRVFATIGVLGEPNILDPFTLDKQVGRKPDGTQFVFIRPRMASGGSNTGAGAVNLFSGFIAPRNSETEGTQRKPPFPNPVFCWEYFGSMSSSSCNQVNFTPIRSILRDEILLKHTIRYAEDAASRASNPTVFTVTNPEKPGERSAAIDYAYVGQAKEMALQKSSEHMQEVQSSFLALEKQSNARETAFRQSQQAGHTDTGSFMVRNSTCDPVRQRSLGPSYHTFKDPLPAGRTIAPGPMAMTPPFLVELMSKMEKFVSQLIGIPAAIYGASDSPMAVNQLVMKSLVAVVNQTRTWLLPVILKLFHAQHGQTIMNHAWKEYTMYKRIHSYIAELRRLRLEKQRSFSQPEKEEEETKPTTDEFSDMPPLPKFKEFAKERYKVSVVFNSLVDPVSVKSWMDDNMVSAATAIALTAAYSGQPEDIFDEKSTQKALDAKLKEKELKSKPPPVANPLASKMVKDKDGKVERKVNPDAAKAGSTQAPPKTGKVSNDPKKPTSATTAPSSSSKKPEKEDDDNDDADGKKSKKEKEKK